MESGHPEKSVKLVKNHYRQHETCYTWHYRGNESFRFRDPNAANSLTMSTIVNSLWSVFASDLVIYSDVARVISLRIIISHSYAKLKVVTSIPLSPRQGLSLGPRWETCPRSSFLFYPQVGYRWTHFLDLPIFKALLFLKFYTHHVSFCRGLQISNVLLRLPCRIRS